MNKKFFFSLLALGALVLLVQSPSVEARHCHHCHHSSTSVQIGLGTVVAQPETYVVRRYVAPAPVIMQPAPYYGPAYVAYPAPAYVEQVYVAPAVYPRPLSGLSFSWNFFR